MSGGLFSGTSAGRGDYGAGWAGAGSDDRGYADQRRDLLSGGLGRSSGTELDHYQAGQRDRMLNTTAKLDDHSARIASMARVSHQNEEIGQEIMHTLHEDRQTLERGRQKLRAIDENMTVANSRIGSIARGVFCNKIILVVTILLLLGAIVIIVGVKSYFWWEKYAPKKWR